jgi:predicted HAD superfamily Cof-like phosphohydrolase
MDKTIKDVKEFMSVAGQHVAAHPHTPSSDVGRLRLRLEYEELLEKARAMGLLSSFMDIVSSENRSLLGVCLKEETNGYGFVDTEKVNLLELLDACVDQRVVADGTILAYGLAGIFSESFDAVHANNMSKFPVDATLDDVTQTVHHYEERGIDVIVKSMTYEGKTYAVYLKADTGKVLKPAQYTSVDLSPILEKVLDVYVNTNKQSK